MRAVCTVRARPVVAVAVVTRHTGWHVRAFPSSVLMDGRCQWWVVDFAFFCIAS